MKNNLFGTILLDFHEPTWTWFRILTNWISERYECYSLDSLCWVMYWKFVSILSFLILSFSLSLLYLPLLNLLTFFGLLTDHSFSIFHFISFSKGLYSSPCLTYVNSSIFFSCIVNTALNVLKSFLFSKQHIKSRGWDE